MSKIREPYQKNTMNFERQLVETLRAHSACKRLSYQKGEVLIAQGQRNQKLYLLNDAAVTVLYHAQSGRRYTVAKERHYSGILGELEIFQPSSTDGVFSVVADQAHFAYVIERPALLTLIAQDSALSLAFLQLLASRYQHSMSNSIKVILYGLQYNVSRLLLNKTPDADGFFPIAITEEASTLGASTRSFRRILKAFLDDKLIEKQGRRYRLLAPQTLKAYVMQATPEVDEY